jgi:hypothetical protein
MAARVVRLQPELDPSSSSGFLFPWPVGLVYEHAKVE